MSAGQASTEIIPSFSGRIREDDFQCIRDSGGCLCVGRTTYWIDGYHRAAGGIVLRLRLHRVVWLGVELHRVVRLVGGCSRCIVTKAR